MLVIRNMMDTAQTRKLLHWGTTKMWKMLGKNAIPFHTDVLGKRYFLLDELEEHFGHKLLYKVSEGDVMRLEEQ